MHTIARWVSSDMSTMRRFATVLVAAGCTVVVPGRALASGFLTDQFGSDHGSAARGNAYAVYFNPGAMAGAPSTDITVDTVVAARSVTFNRTGPLSPGTGATGAANANNATYTAANTGQATLFNVLGAPFVGSVLDFGGSKFRLGIASYIPFGGQVSWDNRQQFSDYPAAPGAYDGPQRAGRPSARRRRRSTAPSRAHTASKGCTSASARASASSARASSTHAPATSTGRTASSPRTEVSSRAGLTWTSAASRSVRPEGSTGSRAPSCTSALPTPALRASGRCASRARSRISRDSPPRSARTRRSTSRWTWCRPIPTSFGWVPRGAWCRRRSFASM